MYGQRPGFKGHAAHALPSASPSVEWVALLPIHSSALSECGIFASASTLTPSRLSLNLEIARDHCKQMYTELFSHCLLVDHGFNSAGCRQHFQKGNGIAKSPSIARSEGKHCSTKVFFSIVCMCHHVHHPLVARCNVSLTVGRGQKRL